VPVINLPAGSGVVKIAGGDAHVLAMKSNGSVVSWGANNAGQLGKGVFDQPLPIDNFSDIDMVAAGPTGSHNLARKSDGSVWSWGLNTNGQLGNGGSAGTTNQTTPVQVVGLGPGSNVVALAAGNSHSLALMNDGTVLAWGLNANGQLGDGTTTSQTTPVTLGFTSQDGVIAIAAGGSFSMALKGDGTVWAWGANSSGQLGNGTFTQSTTPVQVLNLT